MELLFARLPPSLRKGAIRRVAKFLLESTFTSVAAEASVLCNAVAWADSQVRSGLVASGYARLDSLSCGSLPARCFGLLAPQLIIATAYKLTFRASCPTVLIALLLHLPHAVVNCARARPLARHFCFFCAVPPMLPRYCSVLPSSCWAPWWRRWRGSWLEQLLTAPPASPRWGLLVSLLVLLCVCVRVCCFVVCVLVVCVDDFGCTMAAQQQQQ